MYSIGNSSLNIDKQTLAQVFKQNGKYHLLVDGSKFQLDSIEAVRKKVESLHTQYNTVVITDKKGKLHKLIHFKPSGEQREFGDYSSLRQALSEEYRGCWIEQRGDDARYFLEGTLVTKEEFGNALGKTGSRFATFAKGLTALSFLGAKVLGFSQLIQLPCASGSSDFTHFPVSRPGDAPMFLNDFNCLDRVDPSVRDLYQPLAYPDLSQSEFICRDYPSNYHAMVPILEESLKKHLPNHDLENASVKDLHRAYLNWLNEDRFYSKSELLRPILRTCNFSPLSRGEISYFLNYYFYDPRITLSEIDEALELLSKQKQKQLELLPGMLRYLIEKGVNPNAFIYNAVSHDHATLRPLVALGIDKNELMKQALVYQISYGAIDILDDIGATPPKIGYDDTFNPNRALSRLFERSSYTPYGEAFPRNLPQLRRICRLLVEAGADPNLGLRHTITLDIFSHVKLYEDSNIWRSNEDLKIELVKIFIELGATDEPLFEAIEQGNLEGVRLLAKGGANVNTLKQEDGKPLSPLALAVRKMNPEIARCLLENGATFDRSLDKALYYSLLQPFAYPSFVEYLLHSTSEVISGQNSFFNSLVAIGATETMRTYRNLEAEMKQGLQDAFNRIGNERCDPCPIINQLTFQLENSNFKGLFKYLNPELMGQYFLLHAVGLAYNKIPSEAQKACQEALKFRLSPSLQKLVQLMQLKIHEGPSNPSLGLEDVPDRYLCPIYRSPMVDPVKYTRNGHTFRFERQGIVQSLSFRKRCPLTDERLTVNDLEDDVELAQEIQAWRDTQEDSITGLRSVCKLVC